MQITITKVESKDGEKDGRKWTLYTVYDENGTKLTTFDAAISIVGVGDVVDVDVKITPRGNNIENWVVVKKATPETAAAAGAISGDKDKDTRLSIERQSSAATILQHYAELHSVELPLSYAGDLALAATKSLRWLSSRFDDTPGDKLTRDVERIKRINSEVDQRTQADKDFEDLGRDSLFDNVGKLLDWCGEQGIDRPKFMEVVGVKDSEMSKVDVAEAHQKIKDYLAVREG